MKKYVISKKGETKSYTGDMEGKVWIGTNQRTSSKGKKIIDVKQENGNRFIESFPREDVKEVRGRKKI